MAMGQMPIANLSTISYSRRANQPPANWRHFGKLSAAMDLQMSIFANRTTDVLRKIGPVFSMGDDFFSASLDGKMQYNVYAIGPCKRQQI
jgi:hypothetical protein